MPRSLLEWYTDWWANRWTSEEILMALIQDCLNEVQRPVGLEE